MRIFHMLQSIEPLISNKAISLGRPAWLRAGIKNLEKTRVREQLFLILEPVNISVNCSLTTFIPGPEAYE